MYTFSQPVLPVLVSVSEDLTSAAVCAKWAVVLPMRIQRLAFVIKTATVSTGGIVVTFKKYPAYDSSASAVSIGVLTIPTATAAGKVLYKDVSPFLLKEGEMVVAEVTTAAAGGGAAGNGTALIHCVESPEQALNNSNMVASA